MNNKSKIYTYKSLNKITIRLRSDLNDSDFVLLYAHNGTGKTRLSMEFKERGKKKVEVLLVDNSDNVLVDNNNIPFGYKTIQGDTLYFNAYTEDLFKWNNDLENNTERYIEINSNSKFFNGFKELALEEKIFSYLERYADFDYKIDYEKWQIIFSKNIKNPKYIDGSEEPETIRQDNIKISRGEENIFIWCIYLALCELAIDGNESYNWVKYFYIDDPISSLDENNSIGVATDLSRLLKRGKGKIKAVVSTHHSLFFNIMCNELKKNAVQYFLHKKSDDNYGLQKTSDTPFFHHVALLCELNEASKSGNIKTYHFNILRSILEKTSSFFGYNDYGKCINELEDKVMLDRALNLLSHGAYSIYDPKEMIDDNKEIFNKVLKGFLDKYKFEIPELART